MLGMGQGVFYTSYSSLLYEYKTMDTLNNKNINLEVSEKNT